MKLKNISPAFITEDRYDDRRDANQDAADDELNGYMDDAIKDDFVELYDILADQLDLEEEDWETFMSHGPNGAEGEAEGLWVDKDDMKQFMQLVKTGNLKKAWGAIQSTDEIKDERRDDYSAAKTDSDDYARDPDGYNGVSRY